MSLQQNVLLKWLKRLLGVVHDKIVEIILTAALVAIGGFLYTFCDNVWCCVKHTMLLKTPLWATIATAILALLYIHIRMRMLRSFFEVNFKQNTKLFDDEQKYLRQQRITKELLAYYEIVERLATLRLFQPSLTGFDDWVLDFKKDLFGTNDTRKTREEIVNDLQKSLDDYNLTINKYSVSIQENIFEVLKTILKIFEKELSSLNAIGTMFENKDNREIFYERIESYRTLNAKTEEAQKMIRKRIEEIS